MNKRRIILLQSEDANPLLPRLSHRRSDGIEHATCVDADTLFEAARGVLRAMRESVGHYQQQTQCNVSEHTRGASTVGEELLQSSLDRSVKEKLQAESRAGIEISESAFFIGQYNQTNEVV